MTRNKIVNIQDEVNKKDIESKKIIKEAYHFKTLITKLVN